MALHAVVLLGEVAPGSFISALERFAAIGVICGSLRLPSRNMKSCREMNFAGCPAREGMAGSVEFPPDP